MTTQLPVLAIPGLVPFPHTTSHLHIFEPRYRALIQSVENSRSKELLLAQGVALKCAGAPTRNPDANFPEALNKNHRIYEPVDVAGLARLVRVRELDDGRKFVALEVFARVHLEQRTQRVPFVVASFKHLYDDSSLCSDSELRRRDSAVLAELVAAVEKTLVESDRGACALPSEYKSNLEVLTFAAMRFFVLDPELGQKFLEDRNAVSRGEALLQWLKNFWQASRPALALV